MRGMEITALTISGQLDERCMKLFAPSDIRYIRINNVDMVCRLLDGPTDTIRWEILDVLAPPEARTAFLAQQALTTPTQT